MCVDVSGGYVGVCMCLHMHAHALLKVKRRPQSLTYIEKVSHHRATSPMHSSSLKTMRPPPKETSVPSSQCSIPTSRVIRAAAAAAMEEKLSGSAVVCIINFLIDGWRWDLVKSIHKCDVISANAEKDC